MKNFNLLVLAAATLFSVSCKKNETPNNATQALSETTRTKKQVSGPGDVVGKITTGYQGWFSCAGDKSPANNWWHWTPNWSLIPSPTNQIIPIWPDVREYTKTYNTAFASLGNGNAAKLFSSYDTQTIQTHFKWMKENGIDCAALQRFNPNGGEGAIRNAITKKIRDIAPAYNRKFYIMYDISNWENFNAEIKSDWTSVMGTSLKVTASSAYAKQNGKPVVCIWGIGFLDRPGDAATCIDLIKWFKDQGVYVIGGTPTWWRFDPGVDGNFHDSKAGFLDVYHSFDMISPWMVGPIGNSGDSDNIRRIVNEGDVAECKSLGIDYQANVVPGGRGARKHGDFMWHQFANMTQIGSAGLYIAMFDEYGEGNQIAKAAEDASMKPTDDTFSFTLDDDGVHCSSDYYLRLTNDGGRMFKGEIPFTFTRPTLPSVAK